MKKIIILIISLILLSGCYDYDEINDLGIISAIGIDYKDENYIVTLEVLNDQSDKESGSISSYTKTAKSKTLAKAIEKASDLIADKANYTHVKLMILGDTIINDKFQTIVDYFIRSTYFRENFYVVSAIDTEPQNILENKSKENPVASTTIISLLKSNEYSKNSSVLKTFDEILSEILTFGKDTCFSNIALNDEQFLVDGLIIFDEYEKKDKLNNEEATIYNILTNNFYRPIYSKEYDNLFFSVAIKSGKVDANIKSNKIIIDGKLEGKIMDNEPNFDIRDLQTLNKLDNDFKIIINEKLTNFLIKIQKNKSDILGLSQKYYQQTRIKEENYWLNLIIENNTDFDINKKGLIYEVKDEN